MTMEAVMILLSKDFDWTSAKRVMTHSNFKSQLRMLDPKFVSPKVCNFLTREFLSDDDFTPANVSSVSVAAGAMCLWVRAMTVYCQILNAINKRVDKKVKDSFVGAGQSSMSSFDKSRMTSPGRTSPRAHIRQDSTTEIMNESPTNVVHY